jgi:hypothetical protein
MLRPACDTRSSRSNWKQNIHAALPLTLCGGIAE